MPAISYALPALFALLTMAVAVCTLLYTRRLQPPNSVPARQAVISFEFARNARQVKTLFIQPSGHPDRVFIRQVRFLTRLDFLFILAYTLFVVFFVRNAGQAAPSVGLHAALVLAPVIGLFDGLENGQMLRILTIAEQHPTATYQPELVRLAVCTWIKWEATALLMLLLIPFLWQQDCAGKGIAILAVGVFIAGVVALIERLSATESIGQARRFAGLVLLTFAFFAGYVLVKSLV